MNRTIFILLVLSGLFLGSCQEEEVSVHQPTEDRLRERIDLAHQSFFNLRFDEFLGIRSARMKGMLFESPVDKGKAYTAWKAFLTNEKPTMELLQVKTEGLRGIATMKAGVRRKDGTGSESIVYDLWVFENGDWFLDTSGRTSPVFLPQRNKGV
jgi:hypothetical protein